MRFGSLLLLALALGATVAAAQDTMMATTTMAMAPAPDTQTGDKHKWDNIIDLVDSKNDTSMVYALIQAANLTSALDSSTLVATVFVPLDEYISEVAMQLQDEIEADPELLTTILKYHVVPGMALTLDQLTDGMILQTMVEGKEGRIKVNLAEGAKKPRLRTSSGQNIPIYQYDIMAGDAIADTIKGVLIPGNKTLHADNAPAPAPMMM